jgi:hypothetical protein
VKKMPFKSHIVILIRNEINLNTREISQQKYKSMWYMYKKVTKLEKERTEPIAFLGQTQANKYGASTIMLCRTTV